MISVILPGLGCPQSQVDANMGCWQDNANLIIMRNLHFSEMHDEASLLDSAGGLIFYDGLDTSLNSEKFNMPLNRNSERIPRRGST